MVVAFLFLLVLVVSFISAYLSMKDFQDLPDKRLEYSLFLIRNMEGFTASFLDDIHQKTAKRRVILSFERLFKGNKNALVVYGPKKLLESYEDLELLELEDYHKKLKEKDTFAWELTPKNLPSLKKAHSLGNFLSKLVTGIYLQDSEQILIQFVLTPVAPNSTGKAYQLTVRIAVNAPDVSRRSDLAKDLDGLIFQKTPLRKKKTSKRTSEVYGAFKERGLIPREVSNFPLVTPQLVEFLR